MNTTGYALEIVRELDRALSSVDSAECEKLADLILGSGKIFCAGAGRSGFMMKSFAMRLMHMGFESYVAGETVTPNIGPGGLLIIGSGSGETGSLVSMAEKAKKLGAGLALVTISPESPIGGLAGITIMIPAPTPKSGAGTGFTSMQPMGSLFEQSLLLTLDAVILRLMEKQGVDAVSMFGRHANLE